MNLEQYRKWVQRRLWALRGLVVAFLALMWVSHAMTTSHAVDMLMGMCLGGNLMALVMNRRYARALKDDTLLRRLYNEEHDERKQAIRAKAGLPMGLYTSLGMIAAALIASPFNETVMITLVAAAAAQMIVCCAVKLVCLRIM